MQNKSENRYGQRRGFGSLLALNHQMPPGSVIESLPLLQLPH